MLSSNVKHQPALQVASIIGSAFRNFLGPSKSVKFFVDQDYVESVSVTSTKQLLQLLDLKNPVGELIASAVQTHDSVYGCYSTTMVVLLGHWCQEFRSLIAMGYPVRPMLDVGDELLASCIRDVQRSSISLDQLRALQQVDHSNDLQLQQNQSNSTSTEEECIERQKMEEKCLEGAYGPCKSIVEMVRGTTLESTRNQAKEHHVKNAGRTTGCSSVGRSHHPVEVENMVPAESDKWSTYQGIMEDDDVSWFFTDNDNEEETDQILPELTHEHKTTLHDYHIRGNQQQNVLHNYQIQINDMRNVDGMGNSHDMWNYNIQQPTDGTLQIHNVSSMAFGSHSGNNLTDIQSIKILNDDIHHMELGRNCTHQQNHEVIDSDDEFAGCFDNLPNFSEPGKLIVPPQGSQMNRFVNITPSVEDNISCTVYRKTNVADGTFPTDISPGILAQNDTKKSVIEGQQNLTENIDALIRKKMKESSKLSLKGMSQSRHFKTIKHSKIESIEIKNDGVLVEPRQSRDEKSQNINEALKMNLKKKENNEMRMDRILMQKVKGQSLVDQVQPVVMTRCVNGRKPKNKDNETNQTNYHHDLNSVLQTEDVARTTGSDQESVMDLVELLGPALCYGSDQAMNIAMQMFKRRTRENRVNTKWVHICQVLGPSSSDSRVEAGLVLPITSYQVALVTLLKESQLRILLISGDVEPKYHHLGYKESLKADIVVKNTLTAQSSQKPWKQKVIHLLKQLDINIVVAKGTVDGSLCTDCLAENVLVVQRAKYSALKILAAGSEANVLTYILDAEERDIGTVSSVTTLDGGRYKGQRSRSLSNQNHLVGIQTESCLQTAVLCAPSKCLLDTLEDQLMSCIHRLTQAFADDKVLPGAGYAETVAINHLNEIEALEITDLVNRQEVARAMQSGWKSYLLQLTYNCKEINDWSQGMDHITRAVRMNTSPCGCDVYNIVDCVGAKVAAWKTAWKLLGIILRTDTHIATGLDDDDIL